MTWIRIKDMQHYQLNISFNFCSHSSRMQQTFLVSCTITGLPNIPHSNSKNRCLPSRGTSQEIEQPLLSTNQRLAAEMETILQFHFTPNFMSKLAKEEEMFDTLLSPTESTGIIRWDMPLFHLETTRETIMCEPPQ